MIVGVGELNDFGVDAEPIAMMVDCVEAAIGDSGAKAPVRDAIDWIRVPWGVWPYADPGRLVAARIGARRARTTKTTVGGNQVYDLLIDSAARIARGETDIDVVCGAETQRSRSAARRAGGRFEYLAAPETAVPDEVFGSTTPLASATEDAAGVNLPLVFYALAESAIRHRNRTDVTAHLRWIGELWEVGARVAADNPRAWIRSRPSALDIVTASPSNRPITAPYTKMLTSNLAVNQAGAFIVCAAEAAERLGVARDRWIFPWSGVSAGDTDFITNRWALDESPAMRTAGRRALELSELGIDDCELLDLYSCFPAAVQVAQRELGVPTDRIWTITGGLTFAAGPLNCYCLLPLVRAVDLLREQPARRALLTGNGGYFTKHSFVVLGGEPSASGFRTDSVQSIVDAAPTRPTPNPDAGSGAVASPAQAVSVEGTIEAHTVVYDRDGEPDKAILALLDDQGQRHFVTDVDPTVMADLIAHDRVGTRYPPAA